MTYNGLFRICACHFGTVRVAREAANLNMTEIGIAGLFIQTEIHILDSEGSSTCRIITPNSKTYATVIHSPRIDLSVLDGDVTGVTIELNCVSANAVDNATFDKQGVQRTGTATANCVKGDSVSTLLRTINSTVPIVTRSVNGQ